MTTTERKVRPNCPGAAESARNASRGILIAVPPGLGPVDPEASLKPRGLLPSPQIDRGPELRRLFDWLRAAGMDMRTEGPAMQLTVWPDCDASELEPYHGPQRQPVLASRSGAFFDELEKRQPALLIFLGCMFSDVLNEPGLREEAERGLGRFRLPPRRLTDTRLRTLVQPWEHCTVISLPVPVHSISPAVTAQITGALRELFALMH